MSKISGAQKWSGFPLFNPGHWALGMQKLPLLRLHNRAWLCRTNGYGVVFAVGAGALTRPPVGIWIAVQEAPSSVTASPCPPTPFVPLGHFPLIGGIVLPPGGRFEIGGVGSANPGASVNRSKIKFCILRAQWPGRKRRQALLILRAGIMAVQTRRASPVKRGPGKAVLWT